jgi:hypothetical protein
MAPPFVRSSTQATTDYTRPLNQLVAAVVYQADCRTRIDLSTGAVLGERDYVSRLVTRVADSWHALGGMAFAYSRVFTTSEEKRYGSDALILLRWPSVAKLCFFEAKWPRLSTRNYSWDTKERESDTSHFSTQITDQKRWSPEVAIWEQFLHEQPPRLQPGGFDPYGSTCITHDAAAAYDKRHKKGRTWTQKDLPALRIEAATKRRNIGDMLRAVCACRMGLPLPIAHGGVVIKSRRTQHTVTVPVDLGNLSDAGADTLGSLGVSHLLAVEIALR